MGIKVWWHAATLFIYFYINQADIQYLYILLVENHSCYPHCFELGPALQQTDALLSEPLARYLSHAAPYLSHADPLSVGITLMYMARLAAPKPL